MLWRAGEGEEESAGGLLRSRRRRAGGMTSRNQKLGMRSRKLGQTLYFLCVVLSIESGMIRRATGVPPMMCESMISSTSSGSTLPYQTASG
jgi:hypothetical protein